MLFWRAGNGYITFSKNLRNSRSLQWLVGTVTCYSSKPQTKPSVPMHDSNFQNPIIIDPCFQTVNWHPIIKSLLQSNRPPDSIRCAIQSIPALQVLFQDTKQICRFAQDLIKGNLYEYALDIIRLSNISGPQMRHNEYEQIVYQFAIREKWNFAHLMTNHAYNATGKWTLRLFNWHLRSSIGIQDYSFLEKASKELESTHFKPSRRTYHIIIEGHLQNSDLANARRALVAMQEAGFALDKSTYSLVLSNYPALGYNQSVEKQAFETLRNTGYTSDTMVLNGILQARIAALDIAGVLRLIKLIDVSPGGNSGSKEDADFLSTYDSIPSQPLSKIRPNKATFNIILTLLARRKGGISRLLVVYIAMDSMGFPPNAITVAAIILAYGNENRNDIALSIVYHLCEEHGLPVDKKNFLKLGSLTSIKDTITSFPGIMSVPPNIWIFNALLQNLLPSIGLSGLNIYFAILQSINIVPDPTTTQIVLTYLRQHHHTRPQILVQVLKTLTDFRSGESVLTVEHLNSIFASYIRRELDLLQPRSWNASSQQLRFQHTSKFSIDKISHQTRTFDPTAGIAYRSFPNKGVRTILKDMIKALCLRNVKSSRATFALRIRREGVIKRDIQAAQQVFDIMISRGIRPNKYHYSAMVETYAAIGMMDQAKQMMGRAYVDGVKPNLIMYSILIQGYARLGLPDLAKETFKEMIESGIRPDLAAIDSLIGAHWFVKRSKTARKMLLDLWPTEVPFPQELHAASLRDLIIYLRARRRDHRGVSLPKESENQRHRRWKLRVSLRKLLRDVKQWQRVETAVSWTQTGISWDYILHSNNV
ncbi:hypothetical protein Clacol_003879 [Clathrus columnatus]|uniref:Pentatricopeptide repeat-containing protein n=1 Tax=Clathrus columnatus TaxID=1419009 RepID=A0AAV5ACK1_9AGAM|nr:hypothetical protein Clacol_003879 [Clathrus columnatus]